ncbi:CheA signal transduction histidine kinase [Methanohalobium evestigatum Z-7303]|uniref:Chemotaxis protein CheA n=1 Tax=Methanohalobium evestigatum (strain ATCC BAA-1072 / DSM 3721 / NBRC 107634 / OCM 161 / Z-7303) TaxID=644295 RepID=D7E8U4_METEZ|nr:chemotaxis protein CheA [Methanohalobium evestigatum]ADI73765.1 CheA signal transduction histidine kinase [Methanohalobium evestigatum Z-7303]
MDMSEYKQVFQAESDEHLQQLNDSLLKLEQNHEDLEQINIMFRSAHTLKGMASTMGFSSIAELTHEMENLMDGIRNKQIKLDDSIIDILFECLDTIESLVETIDSEDDVDISHLKNNLNSIIENGGSGQETQEESEQVENESEDEETTSETDFELNIDFSDEEIQQIQDANQNGLSVIGAKITLDDSCMLKSARSSIVLKKISEYGTIIKTVPSMDDLDEENFETEFNVVFSTENNQDIIKEEVQKISEIQNVTLSEISLENKEPSEPSSETDNKNELETETQPSNTQEQTQSGQDTSKRSNEMKSVQSVRIDIDRLDNMMNLVGELIINKIRINQLTSDYDIKDLDDTLADLDRLTNDIQTEVMESRMVPMDHIFSRFPRMVRDLSKSEGKKIDLNIEGKDIELDRTILDEIGDPLVHLLRNSVDHGIEEPEKRRETGKSETGHIRLSASRQRNSILIEVEDDGKGMNPDKLRETAVKKGLMSQSEVDRMSDEEAMNLIFTPGFSGAEKVTDVSGRGVGMDAVKAKIEELGGSVKTESFEGEGTKIQLQLPLTIAIIQSILAKVSDETYVIPLTNVVRNVSIKESDIKTIKGEEAILLRGEVLPIVRLHDVLNTSKNNQQQDDDGELIVVIVERMGKKVGLIVDDLIGKQEVMIKTLDNKLLKNTKGFAGATILGDGNVALILDISTLI